MSWQLIGIVSLIWFAVTAKAVLGGDLLNAMVYGGILLTNTGLMFLAMK